MPGIEERRRALVTGAAGFIGFHVARRLLADGWFVTSVDGVTPYYDVALKRARLANLARSNAFVSHEMMLEDDAFADAFAASQPEIVVHLAAQAGVRYSLENPRAYIDSNLVGTHNVLEAARRHQPRHVVLASTSSVYGASTDLPFVESDPANLPLSLYAATKRATEHMAHSYAHLWSIPTTAVRFFTVYGPWGRPDMALFKFAKAILADEPIEIYGQGRMQRDFTYVDDVAEALIRLLDLVPTANQALALVDSISPVAPFRVVNIGGGSPVDLMTFIALIEQNLGLTAKKTFLPMQAGDVPATCASTELLRALTGNVPATSVEAGVAAFVAWYRDYFRVSG
jgi:UDP-glucuronate 4-epimerase